MRLDIELRCILFPLIILEMFLQLEIPPVVNYIDWTRFRKEHTCIQGPTFDSACQSKNQAMRSKELSVELHEKIMSRHRSGEGYQNISQITKCNMQIMQIPLRTTANKNRGFTVPMLLEYHRFVKTHKTDLKYYETLLFTI